MNRSQIEVQVLAILSTVLKCEIGPDAARGNTPQWDSLKHIEVVFAIEDAFGLEFSEQNLAELDSVARIVDIAANRHAA